MNFAVVFPTEYRIELYSRLENRRIKQLVRRNKKASGKETDRQPLKERKSNPKESLAVTAVLKAKTCPLGSQTFHRRIKGKRLSRPVNTPSSETTAVPPELVSRLPNALREINRRLTGQNWIWWTMQLS